MTKTASGSAPNLAELSAPAQTAVQSKTISGAYDVASLIGLITELEQWDLKIEAHRARMKKFYIGSFVAAFLSFVLFIVLAATINAPGIGFSLFVVAVVSIFVIRRMYKAVKVRDLPNEVRSAIHPMLKQLRQDLHPQTRIKTTINLEVMNEATGVKSALPLQASDKSRKLTVFEQDLCDVRMPLVDGSTAVLRLNNIFHKIDRTYRASGGKTKSKTKWKKLSTATVLLIPAQAISWEPEQVERYMDNTCEKLSFSDSNGVSVARLDRYYKFKKLSDPPEDSLPVEDVVSLFVRLVAMQPAVAGGAQ